MKEAFHERSSATLSFSFIAFSLDEIPDDLDHVDMLKPDDFNLEPEDWNPFHFRHHSLLPLTNCEFCV